MPYRVPIFLLVTTLSSMGCYAPLLPQGIPASTLPAAYRCPQRTTIPKRNLDSLTLPSPETYLLGEGDELEVIIPDLLAKGDVTPFRVRVDSDGLLYLPKLGQVNVSGMSIAKARATINAQLSSNILVNPSTIVRLIQRGTIRVIVLGEVASPGTYELPRFENDIGHAIAAAGGFTELAAEELEVHRNTKSPVTTVPHGWTFDLGPESAPQHAGRPIVHGDNRSWSRIVLRGHENGASDTDPTLESGDVVVVPALAQEVFYVVGPLSDQAISAFALDLKQRELGNGFLLPRNREIDVVTAVALAGYIDPIESPTTVTVQRTRDGVPHLFTVDLIEARTNPKENLYVLGGDILYLNPDPAWYFRRTFDGLIGILVNNFTSPE